MKRRHVGTAMAVAVLAGILAAARQDPPQESPLLQAMEVELERSFSKLKDAGEAPLYFLAYRVYDVESVQVRATYGAIDDRRRGGRSRSLSVELRVGSPKLDNTHKIRKEGFDLSDFLDANMPSPSFMPIEDDPDAIRAALWAETDRAFKSAQKQFTKVKANKAIKVEEEDPSDDFSREAPQRFIGPPVEGSVDRATWESRIQRISAVYREFPHLLGASVEFSAERTRRYLATSEGTRIRDERMQYRLFTLVETVAEDGMRLWLYDGVEASTLDALPDDARMEEMARKMAKAITELRSAPVAEPYAGPAILKSRAAGVLFHEIFGHRVEGHRQKDEDEGRTFAKKIGQPVMPEFITVVDDPTREKLGETPLNGAYRFDDEGVAAQRVVLVEKGVLKNFLMGRSPVQGFPRSNGHGRCLPGESPVARQGNLVVESEKRVPYAKLREMLLDEVKRQEKPYGLIFDDIAGGFTMTQSFMPQAFKLLPLRVWRVYPDGRPDEILRGVDIVGTPLASLERILCAADDVDVFNGTCGAESGWVPVSASSPSLLVQTIEVERQKKSQDRPPMLPAPRHDPEDPSKAPPRKEERP
ncbi:MAG: TldD/PmbA family protein [Planctomycetes bacterium]|nr:TldD/PmbA family protein [Planctomycetota bacterium]